MSKLFQPYHSRNLNLEHRIVLAPLTRMRATGGCVGANAVEYYKQRAWPGTLLIAEATDISRQGSGFLTVPGIYTPDQVNAWKNVTKAVHEKGATFFLQIWHVGRMTHRGVTGETPVSSSATAVPTDYRVYTSEGAVPLELPRPLQTDELPAIVEAYTQAGRNALQAGFDGVEVHGANGYLLEQFLADNINVRTDKYGGSIENRARLLLEVVDSLIAAIGADKVAVRLSPFSTFSGTNDSNPAKHWTYVVKELDKRNISYLHIIEPRVSGGMEVVGAEAVSESNTLLFRPLFRGTYIAAGGYLRESAMKTVDEGHADLVAFGRRYLANPDLPRRLRDNLPLNPYNRKTFYTRSDVGYTDYPMYEDSNL